MMTFWDTVRGHQLADTLIRKLPDLTESLSKGKRQIVKTYPKHYAEDKLLVHALEDQIRKGFILDHILPLGDEIICVWSK